MHKSWDVFEFPPDPIISFFPVAIDPILFKLADKEKMHNILDEFKFRPN